MGDVAEAGVLMLEAINEGILASDDQMLSAGLMLISLSHAEAVIDAGVVELLAS